MKLAFISIVFLLLVVTQGHSQSREQSAVSDSIGLQQKKINKELVQLKDSINHSLEVYKGIIDHAKTSRSKHLTDATRQLSSYRDRVNYDIQEMGLTARNAITGENLQRVKRDITEIRREYKRIRAIFAKEKIEQ